MISFPAPKVSFAKAGGGKSNSFLTSMQAFSSLPSFSLHPPKKHMLVLDPSLLQSSWLHDEPINEHSWTGQKEGGKLTAVMGTFFPILNVISKDCPSRSCLRTLCPFYTISVCCAAQCSAVAEEHGLSGPRTLWLVSPSLFLPLAVFRAEEPEIWKFLQSCSFHKPNVSSMLWSEWSVCTNTRGFNSS